MLESIRAGGLRRILTAALAVGICMPHTALASGFELREGSADWMANDFAGDTAKAYDAATVWTNPAGMVRLNQNEIDGSVNGIFPSSHFSGNNFGLGGATTPGTNGGNVLQSIATGGVYGVLSITPDFKLGFAGDVPFGQRVTYPGNFVGRYNSLVSSISDEQFTISGAYKINQQLSIGGGPVLDFFQSRLTEAIPTGPTSALTGDPVADLHGSDVAAGFNVGILYQMTPDLRFGLDYRSRIQHDISGTQSIYVPPLIGVFSPATAGLLASQNSPANTKVTLPDSATFGAYWQVTPQLALMSDISWTDWSLLKAIIVTPTNPGVAGSTIPESWRSTVAVSVGANYRLVPGVLLQTGVGFDQSPVTDSHRTSRIPDSNRYQIAIGAQYDITPNLTLQAAYAHLFFASAPIRETSAAGVLIGSYSTAADTASLGVKYRF